MTMKTVTPSRTRGKERDSKTLGAITRVNQILADLATDKKFQEDLKKPMALLALDHWSGRTVHLDRTAEIRACSSVNRIYPRLKEMEAICGAVDIKVPLCHVEERASELSYEYKMSAFGEQFLIDNGLWESPMKKAHNGSASNGKKVPANNINLHFFGDLPDVTKSTLQSEVNVVSPTRIPDTHIPDPFTPPREGSFDDTEATPLDDDTWKWQMSPTKETSKIFEEEMSKAMASSFPSTFPPSQLKFEDDVKVKAVKESPQPSSDVFLLLFFYIACVASSLLYSGRYDFNCTEDLPWVNKQNATNIVMNRLKLMEKEYESALLSDQWVSLRSEQNMTVEVMKGEEGARSIFVRLTAIYQAKPDKLYKKFKWENYDATMKVADPSYESSSLLFSPETKFFFPSNEINLVRQITSPIFKILPRRELTIAVVEKHQGRTLKLKNIKIQNNSTIKGKPLIDTKLIKIPRGTLIKAIVSVNVHENSIRKKKVVVPEIIISKTITPPEDTPLVKECDVLVEYYLNKMEVQIPYKICRTVVSLPQIVITHITLTLRKCDTLVADLVTATTRYKKISLDMINYFIHLNPGGTLLVVVMRLDPGDDIPVLALEPLVALYGVNTLKALKIALKDIEVNRG